MKKEDIPSAMAIWGQQFVKYCRNDSFPDFWNRGKSTIRSYLVQQIEKGNAIVARKGEAIAGYVAWMCVDFHNERTAFCPTVGHAALMEDGNGIYHTLYTAASQYWVQDNRFNHLWMTYYDDLDLKDMLYDIGFGSYVIDACRKVSAKMLQADCPYKVTRAEPGDADALLQLEKEMLQYLFKSPIYLVKECSKDYVLQAISRNRVLIAWDNDRPIGVMSVQLDPGYHFERLTTDVSGYIVRPGAFVKPEYQRKGIGARLLKAVFDCCTEAGNTFVHVSFETANPNANQFWLRYFNPAIRSVRRTVNKDANSF